MLTLHRFLYGLCSFYFCGTSRPWSATIGLKK
jgi:hypothetical protein